MRSVGAGYYSTHRNGSLTLRVSFYWGPTGKTWDLDCGSNHNGNKVRYHRYQWTMTDQFTSQVQIWHGGTSSWQNWKLIPVEVAGVSAQSQPLAEASYNGDPYGQSSTHAQHVESKHDGFGTIVNEVTIVTTTNPPQQTLSPLARDIEPMTLEFLLSCPVMIFSFSSLLRLALRLFYSILIYPMYSCKTFRFRTDP